MAKGSGTTRASGSRNPQGISNQVNRGGVEWRGSNGIYSTNTEYGRAGVSYFPLDDEYNVIVNGRMYEDSSSKDLSTAQKNAIQILATDGMVEHMRYMDAFDVRGTWVQMSKTEYGNKAIRVAMASPSTSDYQIQNRELTKISDFLNKLGVETRYFVDNVRGQRIGYIEYLKKK